MTDAEGHRSGCSGVPGLGCAAASGMGARAGAAAVQGSGTFRVGVRLPRILGFRTSASGAAAKSTGSHAAPDPADEPGGGEDDRTRAIPTVKDDR